MNTKCTNIFDYHIIAKRNLKEDYELNIIGNELIENEDVAVYKKSEFTAEEALEQFKKDEKINAC